MKKKPAEPERTKPKRARKHKIRIHEVTSENDIRYRGPLTYQHFQLLGWLCITAAQVAVMLKLGGRLDGVLGDRTSGIREVITYFGELSLPFLLIANFAQILNAGDGYRKQLLKNAGAMAGIFGVSCLFYYRYLIGGLEALIPGPGEAEQLIRGIISEAAPYGFLTFNIFVDLFLCTLVMLFLNYRPVRLFRGKSVIAFRLLVLLPIGYEVGCMVLKIQAARNLIRLPFWTFPLLPVKPPMTFVLFIILALFVKTRELRFRRHGKTHEEYQAFLKTRRNSWNFSVFLSVMILVVCLVDFLVLIGFTVNEGINDAYAIRESASAAPVAESAEAGDGSVIGAADGELSEEQLAEELSASFERGINLSTAIGFGSSIPLLAMIPFVLLFSYTRKPKYPMISMLAPVAGIALIVLIYLEGFHALLYYMAANMKGTEGSGDLSEVISHFIK